MVWYCGEREDWHVYRRHRWIESLRGDLGQASASGVQ